VARLETLEVRVTRGSETTLRAPVPIGLVDSARFRGAQLENGLDETLSRIPGVYAANRFNPSLDQRLVIRGAGARANFGVRGLKILIDGLPQTLPDGQSQLTNLDLGFVDRAEVLLGAASALYGNAAGGVIAFGSSLPTEPWSARARVTAGRFGTTRLSALTRMARGSWSGAAAVTRYQSDGSRQQSATETRQLSLGLNRLIGSRGEWLVRGRYFYANSPEAQNPGALTAAELNANPDSAAAANLLRGADKAVRQHQLGLTLLRSSPNGANVEATIFGLRRDLENPLATAPPGPPGPTVGTFSAIDRIAGGARVAAQWPLGPGLGRLQLGADLQVMRDNRENRRARAGVPVDTITADQRETVSEIGPFASVRWPITTRLLVTAATRYDRVRFRVADRYLGDGIDQSGIRSMSAASGSLAANFAFGESAALFGSVASAFETPTTTELVNQSNGTIGFNTDLGPQRSATIELGARTVGRVATTIAVYRTRVRDALVQAREQDGRAYFENAARLRVQGIEAGVEWRPAALATIQASYTHSDARFTAYRSKNGAAIDTLDGNQVPGVPRHTFRGVIEARLGPVTLEWDQQIVSRFFTDDRNALPVAGWKAGITAVRAQLQTRLGRAAFRPFVAINNLWDRRYVAAANVNGFGGRVFEPAPGRWGYLGAEVALR
jgi:iron complex outermembrane receptor protein